MDNVDIANSGSETEDSIDINTQMLWNQYVEQDGDEYTALSQIQIEEQLPHSLMPPTMTLDNERGSDESDYESEQIDSDRDSDMEENQVKNNYTVYNPREMSKDFKFELGMEFTSIEQFKSAVREYALLHGYDVRFVKNDKVRCRVVCRGDCEWLMYVSKVTGSLSFRLKTFNSRHTCGVTFNARMATSKWIAEKITGGMRSNKNMKIADVISSIRENYMADVSVWKAFTSRKKAKALIDGDYKEQYGRLWDYCHEVRTANPGSTFDMHTERPFIDRPPMFKRLYLCLEAVKRGFLAACRPIIGLDGCFLKGPYGGILLVAVTKDPNEQYFPLAVAVVEGENRDSWTWFLNKLLQDIGSMEEKRWVFISDQQKVK